MKVAVIGVTGLVGQVMLEVLEKRHFPIDEFIPVASEKSFGKNITFLNHSIDILTPSQALKHKPDLALFSAGAEVSKILAPQFAAIGTRVIDNSSAWRMDPDKKLIVPEINGEEIGPADYIIANPNCSTIQLVMVIAPLQKKFGIERMVISTYQSVTGSGSLAVEQLDRERKGQSGSMFYPHPIDKNCLPQIDSFEENGYTKEEMKIVNETRKILSLPELKITVTAVRIPVTGGHSESVNLSLKKKFSLTNLREILEDTSGIEVVDDPSRNRYPMPITSQGKDTVFAGRIRIDESQENGLNLWIVADNLRKGAATNAVQIGELLLKKKLV